MTAAARAAHLLGVEEPSTEGSLLEQIRHGLSYEVVEHLQQELDLSVHDLAEALAISQRTLSRRKKAKSLSPEESDRVFRIARVFAHALEVFEDRQRASGWFKKSNRALEGRTPLDVFDTDLGAQMVDDVLTRIEYGVYT